MSSAHRLEPSIRPGGSHIRPLSIARRQSSPAVLLPVASWPHQQAQSCPVLTSKLQRRVILWHRAHSSHHLIINSMPPTAMPPCQYIHSQGKSMHGCRRSGTTCFLQWTMGLLNQSCLSLQLLLCQTLFMFNLMASGICLRGRTWRTREP